MDLSTISNELQEAIENADFQLFERCCRRLSPNYNVYIINDPKENTQLNVLHLLSGFESTEFVLKLIAVWLNLKNVDIDFQGTIDGNYGITAAHIAVLNHNTKTLRFLIERKCDLFKCDSCGKNVQDYAMLEGESFPEILDIVHEAIQNFFQSSRFVSRPFLVDTLNATSYEVKTANRVEDKIKNEVRNTKKEKSKNCSVLSPIHSDDNDDGDEYKTPVMMRSMRNFVDLNALEVADMLLDSDKDSTESSKEDSKTINNEENKGIVEVALDDDELEAEVEKLYEQLGKKLIEDDCISIKLELPSKPKNTEEIYIHKDKDIEFVEKRTPGTNFLIEEQFRFADKVSEAGGSQESHKSHKSHKSYKSHSSQASQGSQDGNTSIETVIDDFILKMTNSQLRDHFRKSGKDFGPINDLTRKLYLKKANRELKNVKESPATHKFRSYLPNDKNSPYLIRAGKGSQMKQMDNKGYQRNAYDLLMRSYRLDYDDLFKQRFNFQQAIQLEEIMVKEFSPDTVSLFSDHQNYNYSKPEITFFVYLLLDPEITQNLPERANVNFETMIFGGNSSPLLDSLDPSLFVSFVKSIFYVGKGKNNRPYQHFYDAISIHAARSGKKIAKKERNPRSSRELRDSRVPESCRKTEKILDIWSKKRGPVSLHCFHGISADEAFAREYLIIETLGLQNLTNRISGNSRIRHKLNGRQRQILGTYLLYKAFIMLLLNGERQIKRTNKLKL